MPTYRNDTNEEIFVTAVNGARIGFKGGQTLTSPYILSDANITRTSDAPYYKIALDDHTITLSTIISKATYTANLNSNDIRVVVISGAVEMYINSYDNLPAIRIVESLTIKNDGRIQTLYFVNVHTGASIVNVKGMSLGGGATDTSDYTTYSVSPSLSPSLSPSKSPSLSPSLSPSVSPSQSLSPSLSPSVSPSQSLSPSLSPSKSPSVSPSLSPSVSPGP